MSWMKGLPVAKHDAIVIGASAGGVEALLAIVAALPAALPASIFVVLHQPPNGRSVLPALLSRAGSLPATHAEDGEIIRRGHIYVAPPDLHMLIEGRQIRLARGPRENRHRPSADPLFRSAARYYRERAVGVILTGSLDDGSAGLLAIKRNGGIAVVQDPNDALFPGMPQNALDVTSVDHCLPLAEISSTLVQIVSTSAEPEEAVVPEASDDLDFETRIAQADQQAIEDDNRPGTPSQFGCPECGGVLWEIENDRIVRFRCRVGHAYSSESLLESQTEGLEAALWSALRALEEKASLTRRLADRARAQSQHAVGKRFSEQMLTAELHAETIRNVLLSGTRPETSSTSHGELALQQTAGAHPPALLE
jgi:two-component system chemotaxis response regulator CheB